jgi:hypothetical protein
LTINSFVFTKTTLFIGLFMVAFQCHAQVADFDGIPFNKADRIALECKHERLDNLPELAHKLTSGLTTDVERFRAIYRWVCGTIANDYPLYERNLRKRQRYKNDSLKLSAWNEKFRKLSFKILLKDHRTICTGYAYLVKELSDLANIECVVVQGYARTSTTNIATLDVPNHSWNAVKLDGKWYLCDPTWASGTPNATTHLFEFNYNDGFFLPKPELFAINHFPIDKKWLLIENNAPTFESFLEAPVFYGKTYTNLSGYTEPTTLHNTVQKHDIVIFKCELLKPVAPEAISLLIDSGNRSEKVHPKDISIKGTSLSINYAFERTGFYDVHLYIGTDLISSYTFRVKNKL